MRLLPTVSNRIHLKHLEDNTTTIALCRAVTCHTGLHLVPINDSPSPIGPTPQAPISLRKWFQAHPSTTGLTYNPFGILISSATTRTPNTSAPMTQTPTPLLHVDGHIATPHLLPPRRRPHGSLLLPNICTFNIHGLSRAKSRPHKLIAINHLMAANDVGVSGLQETKALLGRD
jgi:hypothetical protein